MSISARAGSYENIQPHPKRIVRESGKKTNITNMNMVEIFWHVTFERLIAHHWRFLVFLASFTLNVLWFVQYYK